MPKHQQKLFGVPPSVCLPTGECPQPPAHPATQGRTKLKAKHVQSPGNYTLLCIIYLCATALRKKKKTKKEEEAGKKGHSHAFTGEKWHGNDITDIIIQSIRLCLEFQGHFLMKHMCFTRFILKLYLLIFKPWSKGYSVCSLGGTWTLQTRRVFS